MSNQIDPKELESELQGFCGSENFYRHPMTGVIYTDGVKYLAEKAEAYWLIDTIASYQYTGAKCWDEEFQVWTLNVFGPHADLLCTDGDKGDGPVELARQTITFTDFPVGVWRFYLEFGSLDGENIHKILMLPSER